MADQIPPYTPPPIPKSNDNIDKDEIIKQLKAQLEEERTNNEAIAKSAAEHVKHLEDELREAYASVRKERELNSLIAKSADDHVNELIQQLAELGKTINKLNDTTINEVDIPLAQYDKPTTYIYQGYLDKRSPTFPFTFSAVNGGWQRRYFVLSPDGVLIYWLSEEDFKSNVPCKGLYRSRDILPQDRLSMRPKGGQKSLRLILNKQTIELEADSEEEANKWFVAILSTFPLPGKATPNL